MTKQIVITHPSFSSLSCCPSGFRDYACVAVFDNGSLDHSSASLLYHGLFDAEFVALLGREHVSALGLHKKKMLSGAFVKVPL